MASNTESTRQIAAQALLIVKLRDEIVVECIRSIAEEPPFKSTQDVWNELHNTVVELFDRVRESDYERMHLAAVQVGAMTLRFLIEIELDRMRRS